MTKDVLIYASEDAISHKRQWNLNLWDECWWKVNGMPQQCERGCYVWFSDGDEIIGGSQIKRVEEGRIVFKPLKRLDVEQPCSVPNRGFKYVDPILDESNHNFDFFGSNTN
ncbi:hypothetical protein [Halorubrum halophilum]|uniref:hypothetical protein n=1 Tax=Halorubrum halophilum TaxID=413816 RepID=UPI00186AEC80|nr:hypothetical protein [Halorubrum halophilum]